jgi:hypothetical protein
MPHFTSPNSRIVGPLPRRDILAVCAFLNRSPSVRRPDECCVAEKLLDRLTAAARMQ